MKKELKRKISKEDKGITLIALVITIIILLILAGVTLNAALSENGLFKKAKYAAEEYNKKAIQEQVQLLMAEKELESVSNGTNQRGDITDVLEKVKESDGPITKDDIDKFNEEYLKDYEEKIQPVEQGTELSDLKNKIEGDPNGIYVQLGDITDEQTLSEPIGTEEEPFTGVYNGNGHTINSLTINTNKPYAGMFGVNKGTVKDVIIKDCNITSSSNEVGVIAGRNYGVIENCSTKNGTVYSTSEERYGRCNWWNLWI